MMELEASVLPKRIFPTNRENNFELFYFVEENVDELFTSCCSVYEFYLRLSDKFYFIDFFSEKVESILYEYNSTFKEVSPKNEDDYNDSIFCDLCERCAFEVFDFFSGVYFRDL